MDLTALIACKDRDFNIECCLHSINACAPKPYTILVDFGSCTPLNKYMKSYSNWLTVVRVSRNTGFFHKARALNIGLKRIKTNFFCATDSDQIFQPNFFGSVYNQVKHKVYCVLCRTYFLQTLPKDNFQKKIATDYPSLLSLAKNSGKRIRGEGCCIGLPTNWALSVHGWNEAYIGYGAEDSDLILRAQQAGLTKVSVNHVTSMIHLPHAKGSIYYSKKYLMPNKARYAKQKRSATLIVNTEKPWGAM